MGVWCAASSSSCSSICIGLCFSTQCHLARLLVWFRRICAGLIVLFGTPAVAHCAFASFNALAVGLLACLRRLGEAVISVDDKGWNATMHQTGLPLPGSPLVISLSIPSFYQTTVDHICCGPHPSGEGRGAEGAVQARM